MEIDVKNKTINYTKNPNKLNVGRNGTAVFTDVLKASKTWDPGSVADGAEAATTVTLAGITTTSVFLVSISTMLTDDLQLTAHYQSAGVVGVVLSNSTGSAVNLASGTLTVVALLT